MYVCFIGDVNRCFDAMCLSGEMKKFTHILSHDFQSESQHTRNYRITLNTHKLKITHQQSADASGGGTLVTVWNSVRVLACAVLIIVARHERHQRHMNSSTDTDTNNRCVCARVIVRRYSFESVPPMANVGHARAQRLWNVMVNTAAQLKAAHEMRATPWCAFLANCSFATFRFTVVLLNFLRMSHKNCTRSPPLDYTFICPQPMTMRVGRGDITVRTGAKCGPINVHAGNSHPPIGTMTLGERADCTLVVFTFNTLHEHAQLPLHDHPGMHGVMRVLAGHVRVRTYTPIVDRTTHVAHVGDIIDAQYDGDEVCAFAGVPFYPTGQVLTPSSPPQLLHPCTHNIHSIEPIDTDAPATAMLDVLMPSYADHDGACGYYELVEQADAPTVDSIVKLRRIPPPRTYWSHAIRPPYTVDT